MAHIKFCGAPRFNAARLVATLLFLPAHSLLGQSLQITSPASGTIVNPGQALTVMVSASATFQGVMVVAGDPIGFSQSLSTAPYQFTLQIPTGIQPGQYSLGAFGYTSPGNPVFSTPITLQVERADTPVSLTIQPPLLHFFTVGPAGRVRVLGAFADGTTTDLTNSSLTSYSSFGTVTAGSYGVVTPAASGGDVLQATYGGLSASIPVTVDFPLNIAPGQKVLYASQTQQFTAQPAGGATPTIAWSLNPTGVGSITSTGQYTAVYTAPSSITAQQMVTVTATNAADNTQTASATVTLNLPVLINVVPSTASLGPSQVQGFGAIVLNAPFTDVIWNLPSGSPGTLDQYGHYTAPSSISSSQTVTIQAISAMDGVTIGSATVTLTAQVATPTFSPGGGTYTTAQTVTISTTTSGASIRYTMDGSTPSETAGTLYSGSITVSATETVNAIAYESGWTDSAVASAAYTLVPPQVATPTFSPAAGTYTTAQSVTISTTTSGASIRYTTDGSTPSETAGTLYSGAVTVGATTTIKAIAYESGWTDSSIASAGYTITGTVATPTFSPAAGSYSSAQTVTISTTTSGASIRYTTDGSTPSETAGTLYSGAITVSATTTIRAISYETGWTDSAVASGTFTISPWDNTNWGYRKLITISHAKVSGSSNLTNFPVLISLASDSNLASSAQTNGNDILFTDASGTNKLNHEIETYVSSTGQLIAWVQVPSVSPTTDTVIYMYYGNPSATNQQNGTGVWDSNYAGVWHLPNGSTLSASDSTSNQNNGTASNATAASGEIDGAASFNGTSSDINVGNGTSQNTGSTFTISAWINPSNLSGRYGIYSTRSSNSAGSWQLEVGNGDGTSDLEVTGVGTYDAVSSNNSISTNVWQYVVAVKNGSGPPALYINGAAATLQASSSSYAITDNSSNKYIGEGTSGGQFFAGLIDEVRLSNSVRSSDWILTEYNSQSSPSTFFSIGSQVNSGVVATPTFSPSAGSYSSAQTVTISVTTSGASIRYTTDGSTPSETAGTLYSGAITVSATTTIKAIGYVSGWADSTVASATFTILPLAAAPTFSPTAGSYITAQTVTINTTTSGASIRYTTDGSTPSETAGTLYGSPITVSSTTTLHAIAYESGYIDSSVASGTFTISPWYNASWSDRKAITIDHTKVSGSSNLTNFPVLISLASDSNLQSTAQTNGNDILFTDASGTNKLNHEIEQYTSSTGQVVAWVQVPSVSTTSDTIIYMYYGNASATNQQNATAVWDSNYLLVEHMANDAASKVSSDSTSNGNTGTTVNNTSAMYTSGKIGGGFSFNGSSDGITYAGVAIGTTSTISAWVNETSEATYNNVFANGGSNGLWMTSGTIDLYNAARHQSNTTESTGTWYYITAVQGGTNVTYYLNGSPDGSFSGAAFSFTANGTGKDNGGTEYFHGIMDELRASNIARSAGWIGTEYNNQNSPSTFFSIGSQVNSGLPSAATPTFSPAAGSYITAQTVTISTTTSGASIRYTTDGSTPSETAGTLYSSPITVNSTTTLNAIAYESGYIDSAVASGTFTISPWDNTNWGYRKLITISHAKVSGSSNLTNFPVLISLASDSNLASSAQTNGNDILFTDASGTNKLNHEIETYVSSTGQLIAWVQVPSVSPTTDTVIYMYYGNPSATNQQNGTGVWDSNYAGVWHLPNGSTLSASDSTSNQNNGTASNATAASGEIDGAASFNGTSSDINVGNGTSQNTGSTFTISAWINPSNLSGRYGIYSTRSSNSAGSWQLEVGNGDGTSDLEVTGVGTYDAVSSNNSISTNVWQYVVAVKNGSGPPALYINGAAATLQASSSSYAITDNSSNKYIGEGTSGGQFFAGLIDEVRLSNSVRSSDWILTEYNSQSSPSTFCTVGGQQSQ